MLHVLFSVCLLADPGKCKHIEMRDAQSASPQQCAIGAMHEAVQWVNQHPGWKVEKFGCVPAREEL